MGRDLRLYPHNANKKELVSFVKSFGNIQQTSHLWDWPEGSVHYWWFDEADYASVTGVEVTIDDTPLTIKLSSYDPEKRFVAAETMKILVKDGRINPVYIEKIYNETFKEAAELFKKK